MNRGQDSVGTAMTRFTTTSNIRTLAVILFSLVVVFGLINCSDQRHPSDLPGTHPVSWSDPGSPDFHGQAVYKMGVGGCTECHGAELDGGDVNVSCVDCHLESGACASCHGGQDNSTGAPPIGLHGETEPTSRAVGAHTVHLTGSNMAGPIDCDFCHVVPLSSLDSSHYDGQSSPVMVDSIAELTFGGYADGGGAVWNRSNTTCENIYCHGAFTGGASENSPVWTDTSVECGSCHDVGSDPASLGWKHAFHINKGELSCGDCHANVVDTNLNYVDPFLHVNGVADTLTRDQSVCDRCHGPSGFACTACHGGVDNETGAPPSDLNGYTSTDSIGVGAHTAHLEGGDLAEAIPCVTCHVVPVSIDDPGHLEDNWEGIAEITWSGLAGDSAVWDRVNATCEASYCHGKFSGGKGVNAPIWTGTNQAECGSCHDAGNDPNDINIHHAVHTGSLGIECYYCHGNVVDLSLAISDRSLHVNGSIDTDMPDSAKCAYCHADGPESCVHCHGGTDNLTGAPPIGLRGESATTDLAVGAHTAHLEGRLISDGVACTECHLYLTNFSDPGHYDADSIAELTWGPLAGESSSWDRTAGTCSDTYCHGNFSGGYNGSDPVWTGTAQGHCGSCHDYGLSPGTLLGKHSKHVNAESLPCAACHYTIVDESLTIIGPDLHVNGDFDVVFEYTNPAVWNGYRCTNNACHQDANW